MKKIITLFTSLILFLGLSQAQDVYFAGHGDGIGKIWKNNTLVYSISDTAGIVINDMKVANDSTIFSAGYSYSDFRGHVWTNDSVLFTTDYTTFIKRIVLDSNGWTAAGGNTVWQNGENLYEYTIDSTTCNLYALAIDTITGDIYAGGSIVTPGVYACVWKNDTIFWQCPSWSEVNDLCFAEGNLYAAGLVYGPESIDGAVWQNDSIIFQIEGDITAVTAYNGSIYWAGYSTTENTVYVWQDGEMLYDHACNDSSCINALVINEFGVYYAGQLNGIATVWKDGVILYQPEDCEVVNGLAVLPAPIPTFTLTVEVDSIGGGTVTGGGIYHYGDTATIEAIPDMGCEFLFWNDGIVTNPRDIIITQDTAFIAHFNLFNYTIETAVVPLNSGTVTGGGSYPYGDTITLEAVANPGFIFERWTDSVTDNPREVIVTQDSVFIAMFSNRLYTITVESDHPDWGSVTGGGTFYYGDTIEIAATANLGFSFISWNDGDTDNPREIIVTDDMTFTAHFGIQQCLIQTEVMPADAGTVTGGGAYYYGDTITLTAHNNTGYAFDQWDDGETANPRTIIVEGDATYTAVFKPLQYEITTECDPVDGGMVSGAGTYDYGSIVTLTATPNEYYAFLCWSDGIASNPRNITVTGNANYKAMFHLNGTPQYTITVVANDTLLGTVTGGGTFDQGATIEISATPNAGARFMSWDDGNTDNPRSVIVTQNMTFMAVFTEIPVFTITVRPESQLLGSTYGSGTYMLNQVVTIGATPHNGFYFSGWQDGNSDNPRTIVVTGNAEYIASFSQNPVQTYTVDVLYDESQGFILGAGTYTEGSIATIAAIPADGFYFKRWDDGTTDNPKQVLVDHDIVLAAFFEFTSVDENGFESFSLYPNPANDKIHIEGLEGEHEAQIYNAFGILVMTTDIDGVGEINIEKLTAGLYFIRINGHALRFIKE